MPATPHSAPVVLATPLTVTNFSSFALVNGLTLNSTLMIASGANNTNLTAVGTQTIGGSGTIVFGGTGFDFIQPSAGALTVGPNITIRSGSGGGTLGSATLSTTNQGTISSQTVGAGIMLVGAPFTNQGYVQAINGGSLLLNGLSNAGSIVANASVMSFTGSWSNTGSITATNSTVNFGGSFTPASIGTFTRGGGTVTINGTVTNTGTTFDLSAISPTTGSILLNVGTINGGTLSGGVNAATIDLTGNGTLNGVTLATPLTVSNFSTLALVNGLTLNSTTITISSAANNTIVTAIGTQTIGGTGTILFGGTGFDFMQPSAGALTIGPNITIQTNSGGGTLGTATLTTTNQGTISSQTAGTGIVLVGAHSTIKDTSRRSMAARCC